MRARVTPDYTFRHYGEYFIVRLSYGVPLVNRKVPGEERVVVVALKFKLGKYFTSGARGGGEFHGSVVTS